MKIVIVDYDTGNVNSIKNMLARIGATSEISGDKSIIEKADKLILPGVGTFDQGMRSLMERDLVGLLQEKVMQDKTPLLGICLGMQLLGLSSEEGELPGLGWVNFRAKRFNFSGLENEKQYKTPHIGWSEAYSVDTQHTLMKDVPAPHRFYFVHSYHFSASPENKSEVLLKSTYGYEFVSGVCKGNVLGVQFHPEKSHKFGMQLLKNFIH